MPNGTYSLLCSRVSLSQKKEIKLGNCGGTGQTNAFTTNRYGEGAFTMSFRPLPDSTSATGSLLSLAYHSDRQARADGIGAIGKDTHVQLIAPIPTLAALKPAY